MTLSSGSDTYTVTSASEPSSAVGAYRVGRCLPGTYTLSVSRPGTSPTSVIVTLAAGQSLTMNPVLIPPASIGGIVRGADGSTMPGVQVALFKASEYPAQPTSTTTTDASGRYSFPDVDAPQAYVLEVRSSTQGTLGSSTLVLAASQAAQIDITVGTRSTSPTPTTTTPAPAPASVAPTDTTAETTPTTTAEEGSP